MSPSKRYKKALENVDQNKVYSLEEAVGIIKSLPLTKFDETLELSCKLSVDAKKSEEMVRGSVMLPNGTGKDIKVLVFCESEKEQEAKDAGADYAGSDDLADKILKEGWLDFDYCISTPSMMRVVGKLGKVLGPRGLMPSPKTGAVTPNIAHAVKEAKRGKIDFRMDKVGCIHVGLGKISFTKEALVENVSSFLDALIAAKPSSSKGEFFKDFHLSSTMGPSVKVIL